MYFLTSRVLPILVKVRPSTLIYGLQLSFLPWFAMLSVSFLFMAANTRFATGVHILVFLATEPDSLHTSMDLAEHLRTNPVVIRRALSSLQRADLVVSYRGSAGGSCLARSAKAITLADIYTAVESNPLFFTPEATSDLPRRVNAALDRVFFTAKKYVPLRVAVHVACTVAQEALHPDKEVTHIS